LTGVGAVGTTKDRALEVAMLRVRTDELANFSGCGWVDGRGVNKDDLLLDFAGQLDELFVDVFEAASLAREVKMTLEVEARFSIEVATWAPCSLMASVFPGERFQTVRWDPWAVR